MIDAFVRAFGAAVEDVRAKLVDESWFGRRVTPPADRSHPLHDRDTQEPDHDPLGRTRDLGIDR